MWKTCWKTCQRIRFIINTLTSIWNWLLPQFYSYPSVTLSRIILFTPLKYIVLPWFCSISAMQGIKASVTKTLKIIINFKRYRISSGKNLIMQSAHSQKHHKSLQFLPFSQFRYLYVVNACFPFSNRLFPVAIQPPFAIRIVNCTNIVQGTKIRIDIYEMPTCWELFIQNNPEFTE